MCGKHDKLCEKKTHHRMQGIAPFFKKYARGHAGTPFSSFAHLALALAPSELNFTSPIEITWLHL